jgi:hypothetical protein
MNNAGCQVAGPTKFLSVAFNIFECGIWSMFSVWRLVFCGGSYIFVRRVHTCFLLQWFDRKNSNSIWIWLREKRFLTARLSNLAINLARAAVFRDVSTKCGESDVVQFGTWKFYSGGKNRLLLQINLTWRWKKNSCETLASIYEST